MHPLILVAVLAQQLLPAGPIVRGGLADVREPRVALGILKTNLFADELRGRFNQGFPPGEDLKSDTHGVVELGTNFPLLKVGAVVLSLQGGLISRFRLDAHDNDALSSDYIIALPFNYARGPYAARVRLIHRSGHLGDELEQNTTIRRIEFDHEEVDGLLLRNIGTIRLYAGGTLTVASSFDWDKRGAQVGADGHWRLGRTWSGLAGVDWQHHTITKGNSVFSGTAGLEKNGPAGSVTLQARFLSGATPIGEFFLDREKFWGLWVLFSR